MIPDELHPMDAQGEWEQRTLCARTLLAAIADLQAEHGEAWGEHLTWRAGATPTTLLLRIAMDLEEAGERIATELASWADKRGTP